VLLGRAHGCQDAVLERLYRAFFTEQRSIFEHNSLTALAVEAGLDRDDVARVLVENTYADAVEFDLAEARAIPVNGVPFFVFDNRYAVSGAQRPAVLVEGLARAWADVAEVRS